jgi:hypothetical protein
VYIVLEVTPCPELQRWILFSEIIDVVAYLGSYLYLEGWHINQKRGMGY